MLIVDLNEHTFYQIVCENDIHVCTVVVETNLLEKHWKSMYWIPFSGRERIRNPMLRVKFWSFLGLAHVVSCQLQAERAETDR